MHGVQQLACSHRVNARLHDIDLGLRWPGMSRLWPRGKVCARGPGTVSVRAMPSKCALKLYESVDQVG